MDGVVSFGKDVRGKRKLLITPDKIPGEEDPKPVEKLIARGRHLTVNEGDYVRAGEPLMDGPIDPHDILRVKGPDALSHYLVDQIQEVYRLQGVKINDKHVEVIVRQMLKKVLVTVAGDSAMVAGELVDRVEVEEMNRKIKEEGGDSIEYAPILLGITKASLSTKSFISASSFPRDYESSDRSCSFREGGRTFWPQRKRYYGPPHSCWYRNVHLQELKVGSG